VPDSAQAPASCSVTDVRDHGVKRAKIRLQHKELSGLAGLLIAPYNVDGHPELQYSGVNVTLIMVTSAEPLPQNSRTLTHNS
jgi:hypothetical protein